MNSVVQAALIYLILLTLFRLTGKRTLAQTTPFELVLLLIISEAVQGALTGDDNSKTQMLLLVSTMIGITYGLSYLKEYSKPMERILDDVPLIILEDGTLLEDRCKKVRVDGADILSSARQLQGLERLDQIKFAVLETSGSISIIPKT